jgi:hypothetical protein
MTTETINDIGNSVFQSKDINPSQLEVSSRQINYWIDNAVVLFVEKQQTITTVENEEGLSEGLSHNSLKDKKTMWVRLNLAQATWAALVKELFKFKVPLDTMQELAYQVWQQPRLNKYADEVFQSHIKKNPNNLPEQEIEKLKAHLKDELLMELHFRTIINPFTDMIKSALYRDELPHNFLYVPETNEHMFHYESMDLILNLTSIYLQKPMICIPIVPILSKILLLEFDNKKIKKLQYLSNIEQQIRDIVVFKRPKFVEIAFQEGDIKPIVVTEQHKSREQLAEYILKNKIKRGSKLLIDIRSNDNYKITLIN